MKKLKRGCLFALLQMGFSLCIFAQKPEIQRIDPTNWYVGMKNPKLQLLVYGKNISVSKVSLRPYTGVKLLRTHQVENPNYLFLDLEISKSTKAGNLKFDFRNGNETLSQSYELKPRLASPKGLNQSDFIYLIMPDRFVNGDTSNDKFSDLNDTKADKNDSFLRHGGDLVGITSKLDYLKDLGVTAIWMTPLIENNTFLTDEGGTQRSSYHGYHFTDFYQIDKRFGGNDGYKKFVNDAHAKGIKVVQDAVYNHIGPTAWFYKDMPMKDWVHQADKLVITSHKDQSLPDNYGSEYDRKVFADGWFTDFLPDLNQKNPFLANYLIQNAIWTTENYNIDAWRIDTYKYNDLAFMNRCNQAILDEFPNIHLVGESTASTVVNQAYHVRNTINFPFKNNLPGTLDFMVQGAIWSALKENFGWDDGVNRLYQVLANDFVYENPYKNVNFLENHDTDRFFSVIGEDMNKYKIGITWLMTLRGIPHFYYGTEVLMKNFKNPTDAEVRKDFPLEKFEASGRNANENEAFEYVKKLANFRKNSDAISNGKMLQFIPFDGIYAYFRYSDKQRIMVITNSNKSEKEVNTSRFAEILKGSKNGRNVMTNENIDFGSLKIPPMSSIVIEVR